MFFITASAQTQQNAPDTSFAEKDTTYWVYNFRQFRDAVYQGNVAKARAFVDLPITEEYNHIWNVAYGFNSAAIDKLDSKAKPFTEADFNKYFNNLFQKDFINCLLKIKTEELYKKGKYNTIIFNDSLLSKKYWIDAIWDKPDNTLRLYLNSRTADKDEDGVGELSIIYIFEITKKGHIKLKSIDIAG